MLERLNLRRRLLLFFAAVAVGGSAAIGLGAWVAQRHMAEGAAGGAFVQAALIGIFGLLAVVVWVWLLFDEHVGRALIRLAAGLRSQAHAEAAGRFDAAPGRYLGDLGPAASALCERLAATRAELGEAVARETGRLQSEKDRLETLLSDVPAGVLICSTKHHLVFYNGPAADLLGAAVGPGLSRNVFDYLRDAPLRHAHERLTAGGDAEAVSDLTVATADGARILSGRMRLLDGEAGGYVLTLRDVTADLAAHAGQDRLLQEVFDRIRRPAANLLSVTGVLAEDRDNAALGQALADEAGALARSVRDLAERYEVSRGNWAALPATRSADLLDGCKARLLAGGIDLAAAPGEELILRCDGFEIVALVCAVARRLAASGDAGAFTLGVSGEAAGALVELGWQGRPLAIGRLESWLSEPVDPAMPDLTGRGVLATHATECWPEPAEGGGRLRLPIRSARAAGRHVPAIRRRVVYDFDLLFKSGDAALADTPLDDLVYVVFDSETTGLLPDEGDELCQIAGLRLVNGRRVAGEVFDTLVNPGRPIPPRATEVHGITDAMVADAPPVAEAVTRFGDFAQGAVLIAHNAPFDMAFLRRQAAVTGIAFDNPVLDTVLLSAVVYGRTETHSLDALTARLGVTIPEEARHTALGDTIATADAFLRLLPMLKARGLVTFGDVLTEVRKHGRLLADLNA